MNTAPPEAGLRSKRLSEPGVFGFRSDENGNIGVGVFPEREEIRICRLRLRGVALQCMSAAKPERASAPMDSSQQFRMVEDFLEFGCGFTASMGG